MQRVLIATLMALFFGLFSMPAVQAAPANGWAVGSAVKAISPLERFIIGVAIVGVAIGAIGAIAIDLYSIFVTGRRLQAGGPYSSGPPISIVVAPSF
jgi:hypothetical protein